MNCPNGAPQLRCFNGIRSSVIFSPVLEVGERESV